MYKIADLIPFRGRYDRKNFDLNQLARHISIRYDSIRLQQNELFKGNHHVHFQPDRLRRLDAFDMIHSMRMGF